MLRISGSLLRSPEGLPCCDQSSRSLGLVSDAMLSIEFSVLTMEGTLTDDETEPKDHEGLDGVHDDLDGEVRRVSQEAYGFVDVVGIDWLFANPL